MMQKKYYLFKNLEKYCFAFTEFLVDTFYIFHLFHA